MGFLANSDDPDEMQHNAAFHQGLHCLLRLKQPSWTEVQHSLEISTCDPLKYTMGSPILIVSLCIGKGFIDGSYLNSSSNTEPPLSLHTANTRLSVN